jgi:hypothetical protein
MVQYCVITAVEGAAEFALLNDNTSCLDKSSDKSKPSRKLRYVIM